MIWNYAVILLRALKKFYNDDKYAGVFINGILLYSESDINISAIDFLESETFLEINETNQHLRSYDRIDAKGA